MKQHVFFTIMGLALVAAGKGQVKIGATGTPNASSVLELQSTTKGLLTPRLTLVQRNAVASPATGLLIFQTDNTPGFYYFNGTAWTAVNSIAADLVLPFIKSQAEVVNPLMRLTNSSTSGTEGAVQGLTASTDASAVAIKGAVTSTTPGGFSTAVRGVNSGTGGLGIGIWGSQDGSGWGVYGVTPNGLGVYGNSSSNGYGIYGNSNSGTGLFGTSINGVAAGFSIFNNANANNVINANTTGNGDVLNISTTGNGRGIISTTGAGFAVHGVTSQQTSAGIVGSNTGGGEGVVGLVTSDIAGAVVGRNDGGGYGVHGFVATSTSGTGIGVYGRVGLNNSTGRAGRFENLNISNTQGNTMEVETNSNGNIPDNTQGNAASFLVNNTNSVSAAVRGEVKTIFSNFGAAGIFGVSSGTGGFGGLFHASNTNGNGPALIAITDGNGNAITANASKNGNAVEANIDGGGIAMYGWVPSFATGRAARFANYNSANINTVLTVENYSSSSLAVFRSGSSLVNVARIDAAGRVYANGGFQASGADVAEYFDVEGNTNSYEPGDVLVISLSSDRKVEKSSAPYTTLVAGVYATKPGLSLTERNAEENDLSGMVPMGVIGVIPTKVCTEGGAIKRGDLLVTSSLPGVAMKADMQRVQVGQVLGKALQDYNETGTGKINVLVNTK